MKWLNTLHLSESYCSLPSLPPLPHIWRYHITLGLLATLILPVIVYHLLPSSCLSTRCVFAVKTSSCGIIISLLCSLNHLIGSKDDFDGRSDAWNGGKLEDGFLSRRGRISGSNSLTTGQGWVRSLVILTCQHHYFLIFVILIYTYKEKSLSLLLSVNWYEHLVKSMHMLGALFTFLDKKRYNTILS